MKHSLLSLTRCQSGAAGAEMALMVPLLVTLMFGAFELGYYFYNEHIVVKGVRDAARYASRQPALYAPEPCVPGLVTGAPAPAIDNVARYGKATVQDIDKPKISGWTSSVEVMLSCRDIVAYSGTDYAGIYKGKKKVPVVTVTARMVEYPSLFKTLGFTSSGLKLNASSESAVMGI